MKETRFLELLNLYVDQEITPEEAQELEREINRNPDRRRVYGQYCRMQRACVSLFESANRQAPPVQLARLMAAARRADEKVTAFPGAKTLAPAPEPTAPWWPRLVWGTGLAACFAFVAVVGWRQLSPAPDSPGSPAVTVATTEATTGLTTPAPMIASLPSEPVAPVMLRRGEIGPATNEARPQFIATWRNLPVPTLVAADDSAADSPSLEWMRGLEFAPIRAASPEQLRFDSRTTFPASHEPRTFRGRTANGFQAEMSAFQFQR